MTEIKETIAEREDLPPFDGTRKCCPRCGGYLLYYRDSGLPNLNCINCGCVLYIKHIKAGDNGHPVGESLTKSPKLVLRPRLLTLTTERPDLVCIRCGSTRLRRHGVTHNHHCPRARCDDCKRLFIYDQPKYVLYGKRLIKKGRRQQYVQRMIAAKFGIEVTLSQITGWYSAFRRGERLG